MSAAEPPGRGMLFAETQLRRHGWRRGQGLGRREDGIAEAIRVKVKCDTAGVGHDAAEPFTFHWWDHVFNKAAANIAVEAGQSATLTACGEESVTASSESSQEEEEEEKLDLSSVRRLTDEELVQACGGRTAHKGARHGLTMSAKLARLEEQERAFLATYRQREQQQEPPESSQGKKKKRKRSRDGAEVPQSQEANTEQEEVLEEEKVVKKKKKKKQGPSREEEVTGEEEVMRKKKKKVIMEPCGEEVSGEEGKVMKRRKKPELSTEEEVVEEDGKAAKRRKKKKKKKQEEEDEEEPAETDVPLQDTDEPNLGHSPTKKRKKKKRKREAE
ncbi:G patch domain-containing protein 4 isoform X2 [Molothrus ater]|uniref:G patch domain-containing protein 4 isoform X2 n=1 Tax=Molothrus ater TaxID=84834 RepID=UPI00174879CB|nr:G patch domain-containing protein 4 isoform X2 [Molothrus ater]